MIRTTKSDVNWSNDQGYGGEEDEGKKKSSLVTCSVIQTKGIYHNIGVLNLIDKR